MDDVQLRNTERGASYRRQLRHRSQAVTNLSRPALEMRLYRALANGHADEFCLLLSHLDESYPTDPERVQAAYQMLAARGSVGAIEQIAEATGISAVLSEDAAQRAYGVLAASARIEAIDYVEQISTTSPRFAPADVQFGFRFALRSRRYAALPKLSRISGVVPDFSENEVAQAIERACEDSDFQGVEFFFEAIGRTVSLSGYRRHVERVLQLGRLGEIPSMIRLFEDFDVESITPQLYVSLAGSTDSRAVRFAYLNAPSLEALGQLAHDAFHIAEATDDTELRAVLVERYGVSGESGQRSDEVHGASPASAVEDLDPAAATLARRDSVASGPCRDAAKMHVLDEELFDAVFRYLDRRIHLDPPPLDRPGSRHQIEAALHGLINAAGNDPVQVLETFTKHIAPTVISADSPRFFAFAPNAPTKAALLFDMIVACSSLQGISWLEAAGVVAAEEQALRFLTTLTGMPIRTRGCFVSGGTQAALAALVVARDIAEGQSCATGARRALRVAVSDQTHASLINTARAIGADPIVVPTLTGRLTGETLLEALHSLPRSDLVIAAVGSAGTTNAGQVDDLQGIADVCKEHNIWFHVDAAFGGAALLSDDCRTKFAGIQHADSVVIDPHKWFFAPYDCAALLYRNPELARKVHTQDAPYLDAIHDDGEWNPSDLAHHCSRRARGLPFWFSLAVHGTDAYRAAVERGCWLARQAARMVDHEPHLELALEPELCVVLFRRKGWEKSDYLRWAHDLLHRQLGFVTPTTWRGRPAARMAFVHPGTTTEIVAEVIASTRRDRNQPTS
ncbi:pyridoxal phosphate-dependent decarboxylase family protein [Kribbella deserti]|uniref:Pyridoxal phosphate-dependent decarboxylase family protein n=1 Tax=Kribbella deserti TaxID=1926257 RepID=A0ABV6QXN3_9ACTN